MTAPPFQITETRGNWVKATVGDIVIELSTEDHRLSPTILPGVPITYLGIWRGLETLFEFQLGFKLTRGPAPLLVARICAHYGK